MKNRVKGRGYEDTYFIGIPKHEGIHAKKHCKLLVTKRISDIDTGELNRFGAQTSTSIIVCRSTFVTPIDFIFVQNLGSSTRGGAFDMSEIA